MKLISKAFEKNMEIPVQYSQEDSNLSPPLAWSAVPADCKALALVCEDPDAPKAKGHDSPHVHWLIYNIPADTNELPEALATEETLEHPVTANQGLNSSGSIGYSGPMPPVGHGMHHYEFTLFALDDELTLVPGLKKAELLKRIDGHVLETALLVGTYERGTAATPKRKSA